ncbi:hypothetical protein Q4603_01525 [Zobellia galactanivorans]|uniref:Uncharacterized protein n=2 Tax=Zobellia TaxID=112040 RepID=A0ABY1KZK1_9FLAO|nr:MULTISPECIES: hypothetical protein [Zobellia]MBU3026265.1 hypothetical protein [Zobellia galactanivorans]MDO6517429.1 hypothetical protein [Zobellia uliginosa]MDO6807263.1 hypothetical protein [Zobellia galactanivorans]CAZ96487.1 Conserved hypothetical membrane protein [Zobellia galactanivorans]SIS81871.1 hypothetical protein SAMN05421766_104140 [Zobellia uliginosa]
MHKIIKIILVVVGLIGAALWFMLPESEMPASEAINNGALNAMFMITWLLLGIAIVSSVVFALKNLFSNPASLKKSLFVVVGFLLVIGIGYVMASGTDVNIQEMADRGVSTNESEIKQIGAGINVFFILTLVAVGAMLWGGVRKMIK